MVFGNFNGMKTLIPIDKAGRVVLPKEIRQRFHLLSGDKLSLELIPDGVILHASIARPSLSEKNGLLVHEGEAAGDLLGAVESDRANRNHNLLERGDEDFL